MPFPRSSPSNEPDPDFRELDPTLSPEDVERLAHIREDLRQRNLPDSFIRAALRSTADVLRDLRDESSHSQQVLRRAEVQQFIRENGTLSEPGAPTMRKETRREEKERLQANVVILLRQARLSRGRHEVKRFRSQLLRIDQRELRRVLGGEGDELCRQINTWLRSTASALN